MIPAWALDVADRDGDVWKRDGDRWVLAMDNFRSSGEDLERRYGPLRVTLPIVVEITDDMVSAAYAVLPSAAQEALEGCGQQTGAAIAAALRAAGFLVVEDGGEVR